MSEFVFRERRTSARYLDLKVDRIIQGLLNEMKIVVDNTHEEDVTLPEMIDRIYKRLMELEQKVGAGGDSAINSNNVKFFTSLAQFPKSNEASEDVLYIDKSTGATFVFDSESGSYISKPVLDIGDGNKTMTEIIESSVNIMFGGNANDE